MIIKLTNGEAEIKDFCTRKLQKEINSEIFKGVENKVDENGKTEASGLNISNLDNANDITLLGMVVRLKLNEEEMPITIDTFDAMNTVDVDLIMEEINKITKKK